MSYDGATHVRHSLKGNVSIDAYDCGDEASDWLRRHVFTQTDAQRVRLMYYTGDLMNHRSINNLWPAIERNDKVR